MEELNEYYEKLKGRLAYLLSESGEQEYTVTDANNILDRKGAWLGRINETKLAIVAIQQILIKNMFNGCQMEGCIHRDTALCGKCINKSHYEWDYTDNY